MDERSYMFEITYKLKLIDNTYMETITHVIATNQSEAILKLQNWRDKNLKDKFTGLLILSVYQSPYYLVV